MFHVVLLEWYTEVATDSRQCRDAPPIGTHTRRRQLVHLQTEVQAVISLLIELLYASAGLARVLHAYQQHIWKTGISTYICTTRFLLHWQKPFVWMI